MSGKFYKKNVEFLGLENSAKKCRIQQNVEQNVELLRTNQGMDLEVGFELSEPSENDKFGGKIYSIDHQLLKFSPAAGCSAT